MTQVQRFLVKMQSPTSAFSLTISGTEVPFDVTPLFSSIEPSQAIGIAAGATWHVLKPTMALDAGNPWDFCHAIVTQGLGVVGGQKPEFAEPDFQQQWVSETMTERALSMTSSCKSVCQKAGFPGDPDEFWYQNDAYGQFQKALSALGLPGDDALIRVAHLDTGYDPEHSSLPAKLERALQRNFVDHDRPDDASDDTAGLFNNLGHGTGTLSILAGAPTAGVARLGAAPFVKVVPIRVANRVELFYNSAIAQAFDYVHQLCADPATEVQVISMSMGGLASQAWADAVNALYDAGVVVVTAAGNNINNLPTRNIVYPARFNRVIAACGVMADHTPYADLGLKKMAGNYGPLSKMSTALAAYTPNVPWAKFGCSDVVDFDGAGTSAATPQVAAAAAIWLQKNKATCDSYAEKWMRVAAVRKALFDSATLNTPEKLGKGELHAFNAMTNAPAEAKDLSREAPDSASFAIFKVLTGLGIDTASPQQLKMLELEALQLSQSAVMEDLLPDPSIDPQSLTLVQRTQIVDALARHPRASQTLRKALQVAIAPHQTPQQTLTKMDELHLKHALAPEPPLPAGRRLRVYAYDPSLGRELETVRFNETVINVRWEGTLEPGPVGEYVEVVDVDPASRCCYAPVDLNDSRLTAADGLRPSESNPQFHQQMVYAVSMTTIEQFEKALGRVALWSPRFISNEESNSPKGGASDQSAKKVKPTVCYVQRLRIYPHALRAENAYYSPERKALLLGYFSSHASGNGSPSEMVFTALSHDIVAHETSHALLDGLHRRFREPTNPDVLAFHEAFADIVALFQHFSIRESLRDQIAKSHGDLSKESLLAKLAFQFGQATGRYGALRDSIGKNVEDPQTHKRTWEPVEPSTDQYHRSTEPHELGSVLVAAVFDAFLRIYTRRALEPIRLATGGAEVLAPGALSTELADALTNVASKVAQHILIMCIRGLDYCPPVDITFGDYLRAVVTADRDLVPDDPHGYRIAFVSAFSARGIYPQDVRSLSLETILWEPPPVPFANLDRVLPCLDLGWNLQSQREQAWVTSRSNAETFWRWLVDPKMVDDEELEILGLIRWPIRGFSLTNSRNEGIECDVHGIEVHSVRPSRRVGPDGQLLSQLVVEITQSFYAVASKNEVYRGGVTLLIDLNKRAVAYMVRKRADQPTRISDQQAFRATREAEFADNYFGLAAGQAEPFQFLH